MLNKHLLGTAAVLSLLAAGALAQTDAATDPGAAAQVEGTATDAAPTAATDAAATDAAAPDPAAADATAPDPASDAPATEAAGQGDQVTAEQAGTVDAAAPRVHVNQPAPQVTIEQPEPTVTVTQAPPEVTVEQCAPTITVTQAEPTVTVNIPQPIVTVVLADPEVTVGDARPQVTVEMPEAAVSFVPPQPRITIEGAEAQVSVIEAEPQVEVNRATEAQVEIQQGEAAGTATDAVAAPVVRAVPASELQVREGYAVVPVAELSADELSGTSVYAAQGEQIGSVRDVVADSSGQIQQVIVGVGGFLGIGERSVAYPFDQVSFQRQPDGTDLRAYVGTPAAEVQNLPEYLPVE